MRKHLIALLAAVLSLGVAMPVMAQDADEDSVRYKKKTEIDFEDVSVDGELKKPHGAYLLDKRQSSFNPLIKLKADFNKEMIESVTQIR